MKTHINCPICNYPLENIYTGRHDEYLNKKCEKKLGHKYSESIIGEDNVDKISIIINRTSDLGAHWFFQNPKELIINKNGTLIVLPFFEPDFSNYKALVNKIKTYLLLS